MVLGRSKTMLKNYLTKSKNVGVSKKLKIIKLYEYSTKGTLLVPIRKNGRRNHKITVIDPSTKINSTFVPSQEVHQMRRRVKDQETSPKAMLPNVSNFLFPNAPSSQELEEMYGKKNPKQRRSTYLDYRRSSELPDQIPTYFKHDGRRASKKFREIGRIYKLKHISKIRI
ncbi:unnamed protein product [Moneuplotes crassus]|uniref:Uncharacterized protein n=1 Tax=Euplotes crassus TaxID=5936 RepID=A0AAD1U5J5_EUPCR|nr:unnamed protein product [Moneuplotes crassus]